MHYVWVHFIIHTFIAIFISDIEGIDSNHIRKKFIGDNDFFFEHVRLSHPLIWKKASYCNNKQKTVKENLSNLV